jgi:hypothetical protein
MFENRMPRRIFGPKRDEVIGVRENIFEQSVRHYIDEDVTYSCNMNRSCLHFFPSIYYKSERFEKMLNT